jgi:hypothetical protein
MVAVSFVDPDEELGSLVASDDDDFSPSVELDAIETGLLDPTLFGDDIQQDDVVVDTAPELYTLGRSWAFDFNTGRFVPSPRRARAPLAITGMTQLFQWVEMALYTPRGALAIHSEDYGLEDADGLIGGQFTGSAVASLRQRVEEALMFHPKITGIDDFTTSITDDEEGVDVTFRLRLDNNDVVPFSTRLM